MRKSWLDFNLPFDSSAGGSHLYAVSVKHRNDNGSDIAAQTELTVIVKSLELQPEGARTYIVKEGVSEASVRDMIKSSMEIL